MKTHNIELEEKPFKNIKPLMRGLFDFVDNVFSRGKIPLAADER